jgi:hypothetical protein
MNIDFTSITQSDGCRCFDIGMSLRRDVTTPMPLSGCQQVVADFTTATKRGTSVTVAAAGTHFAMTTRPSQPSLCNSRQPGSRQQQYSQHTGQEELERLAV